LCGERGKAAAACRQESLMIGCCVRMGKLKMNKQAAPETKNPVIFMTGFFALLVTPRGFEPRLPP